jgi:glutaconyl-CoA/methylmalonyl-CoA decarboxylase subunit gamma
MKLKMKVDDRSFDVEIESLSARPILATVDGQTFEVWPEEGVAAPAPPAASPPAARQPVVEPPPPRPTRRMSGEESVPPQRARKAIYAPIPGVIDSVAVQSGDVVTAGQEVCVLEAMKMKNIIRAPREGQIGAVCVSGGQHVKHNDLLFEYADA